MSNPHDTLCRLAQIRAVELGNFNPNHVPAGSPEGGEFDTSANGDTRILDAAVSKIQTPNPLKFEITGKPSNSKGWSRYSAQSDHDQSPVVTSNTGNKFISSDKEASVLPGHKFTITHQVMLKEGKYNKETVYTKHTQMIADPNHTEEIEFKPGSQGLKIKIHGARKA